MSKLSSSEFAAKQIRHQAMLQGRTLLDEGSEAFTLISSRKYLAESGFCGILVPYDLRILVCNALNAIHN